MTERGFHFRRPERHRLGYATQSYFEYVPVVASDSRDSYKHPVYVTFSANHVAFWFLGRLSSANEQRPARGEPVSEDYSKPVLLFRLPTAATDRDQRELRRVLRGIFHDSWPREVEEAADEERSVPAGLASLDDPEHYAGLDQFTTGSDQPGIPLRRIFLDFLFELEHGDLFEHSPHCEAARRKLMDCEVFRAISAKAKYYWVRGQLAARGQLAEGDQPGREANRWWVHRLHEAERDWIDLCVDEGNDVLPRGGDWFKDVEDEVKDVVFAHSWQYEGGLGSGHDAVSFRDVIAHRNHRHNFLRDKHDYDRWAETRHVSSWFLRRYDLDSVLSLLVCGYSGAWFVRYPPRAMHAIRSHWKGLAALSSVLCLLLLILMLGAGVPVTVSGEGNLPGLLAHGLYVFFFVALGMLYDVERRTSGPFHMVCGGVILSLGLMGLLYMISDVGSLSLITVILLASWVTINGVRSARYLFLGLSLTAGGSARDVRKRIRDWWGSRPDCRTAYQEVSRRISVWFAGAYESAWRLISRLRTWCWESARLNRGHDTGADASRPRTPATEGGDSGSEGSAAGHSGFVTMFFRLMLPRMVFAITGAWALIVTTDELLVGGLVVGWWDILLTGIPVLLITFFFTAIEVNGRINHLKRAFSRAGVVVCMGLVISVIIGFFATGLAARWTILNCGILSQPGFWQEAKVRVTSKHEKTRIDRTVGSLDEMGHRECVEQLEEMEWGIRGTATEPHDAAGGIPFLMTPEIMGFEWFILPAHLLYRSILALFAGLFLQLLTEEKATTEPL